MGRFLLLLTAALCASAAPLHAKDTKTNPVGTLRSPARASEVRAALDAALDASEQGDATLARRTAEHLGAAGGHQTLDALRTLCGHREESVRVAALEAVAKVALRAEKLATVVHGIAADAERSEAEREAAITALGAIGDGGDIPLLLALCAAETQEAGLRAAAFRAMGSISGAKLPFVHARWAYWWKKQSTRKKALLEKAILTLHEDPDGDHVELYAAVVESLAWLDLPYSAKAIESWLTGVKPHLRPVAIRLAGALGLAETAPRLVRIASKRSSGALGEAARQALEALGHPPPDPEVEESDDA